MFRQETCGLMNDQNHLESNPSYVENHFGISQGLVPLLAKVRDPDVLPLWRYQRLRTHRSGQSVSATLQTPPGIRNVPPRIRSSGQEGGTLSGVGKKLVVSGHPWGAKIVEPGRQ